MRVNLFFQQAFTVKRRQVHRRWLVGLNFTERNPNGIGTDGACLEGKDVVDSVRAQLEKLEICDNATRRVCSQWLDEQNWIVGMNLGN
jgi:hypothetical protein